MYYVTCNFQAKYVDILCINRYFSWYSDAGHTEVIAESMTLDVENWIRKFNKPLIVAEYGADTVAGLHMVKFLRNIWVCDSEYVIINWFNCN